VCSLSGFGGIVGVAKLEQRAGDESQNFKIVIDGAFLKGF
jgi:hypothetical protein